MALSDYTSYPFPQDEDKGSLVFVDGNAALIKDGDTITGTETGNDAEYILFTDAAGDNVPTIDGDGGDDFIEVNTTNQNAAGDNIEGEDGNDTILITNGVDTGTAASNISGENDSDYIGIDYGINATGARGDNIDGGTGNDVIEISNADAATGTAIDITGGADDDIIVVDNSSNIQINGDVGNTEANSGNDTITVTSSTGGWINGGDGGQINDAEDGDDVITVENSTLDIIDASDGQDSVTITDSAVDVVKGGWGNDTFSINADSDDVDVTLYGGYIPTLGTSDTAAANAGASSGGPADVFEINLSGNTSGSNIVLGDFTDEGTLGSYDAEDDQVSITESGSTMTNADFWSMLAGGGLSGPIASVTNTDADTITMTTDVGNTIVVKNVQVACFVTGTSIATAAGNVAVETLAIGDMVTTADGNAAPVKWIGRREVSSVFAAKNASVQPILITEGALGNGLPTADLRVSPDHAMFVDGVLIHAEALVNGSTIVQEAIAETFTYFHIELENHDLVLANGAPAETFVDSDVRARFDNAAEYVALYGTAESAAPMALPRVKSKRQLPAALKAKLA